MASPFPSHPEAFPPLTAEDVHKITFTGRCLEKQWSASREGQLEILLAAEPGEFCVAHLKLQTPLDLHHAHGMRFTARGSRPRQFVAMEFIGQSAEDDALTRARSRPFLITDEWTEDALRFDRVKPGWNPQSLHEIRFIAMSNAGRSSPTLSIRGVSLVGPAQTPLPPPQQPPDVETKGVGDGEGRPADVVPAPPIPQPTRPAAGPPLPVPSPPAPRSKRPLAAAALASLWAAGGYTIWRRKKASPSAASFSPLYELNTRTWKSARDRDGVLHIGGFNKITLADLKAIKATGFNSLWLMGIWEIGAKVRAISKRYGSDYTGSPFAVSDYRVSEELGTEEEFREMVGRAHSAGLKVIVDFVPNHMGLDSPWLNTHPEFFLHKLVAPGEARLADSELEKRHPGYFVYRTPSYPQGRIRVPKAILVAYGKDPYFYPWIDTAQLDYVDPGLRRKMTEVLSAWAKIVDGVRCDMAMLVLREQVKIHRHPELSWEAFNRYMPEEFWPEAIRCAKRVNPSFVFMAETYWAMEGYLQQLGFDYTYNKPLYEAILSAFHSGHAEGLLNFIRMLGTEFLGRGVHFLENHDEERAMNVLGEERGRAAATVLCTLPGIALLHQGQMEGKRERLPVQRSVPVHAEPDNTSLLDFYKRLLRATALPVFREGRIHVLYSNNPAFISYARMDHGTQALVIINTSNRLQKGSVFLTPGLRLKPGAPYILHDLFYALKSAEVLQQPTVQPSYSYPAAQLINQGLYVELHPFDAHLFLFEPRASFKLQERIRHALRGLNEGWPLPRLARRLLGPALMRSSDHNSQN